MHVLSALGRSPSIWVALASLLAACSSDPNPPSNVGTGGAPASGGASVASGGTAVATGGAPLGASGGPSLGTGGAIGTGGGDGSGGASTAGTASGGSGAASGGDGPTSGGGTGGGGPLADVSLFIAGDSTVSTYVDTASTSDQAGWGQMLSGVFSEQVTVDNRAAGGRTALWFHLEGGVDGILEDAKPGDYFFVQFGTNDSHTTATFTVDGTTYQRFAEAGSTFKQHLIDYYITPARAASLSIVLVTPPPRNSAYCGNGNSLGAYAQAMREVGQAEDVPVVDLNAKTFDHLAAVCPAPTPEDFFAFRSDGTVDGTHFQENGARHMAAFVGQCVSELELDLARYLLP